VNDRSDVVVLGAGLQGTGVALELARRGVGVTLFERDERAMNRASLRNEGKIHLGLIYANDRSLGTAHLQLEGALKFRRTIARWIEDEADGLSCSAPFHYLVAPDSIVPAERLAEHYAAVDARCRARFAEDTGLDYLGARPEPLFRRLAPHEYADHFNPEHVAAGFATAELAVDTDLLASGLRRALAMSPRVTFRPSHHVRSIMETAGGYRIEGDGPDGAWRHHARVVVNATWEQRSALDLQLGIPPPPGLLHRLKFRVIARLPEALRGAPSVSMVLGRYGDLVVREDGTAFLSWYPVGLRGWSHDIAPPATWEAACRGELDPRESFEIAEQILAGMEAWFPGVARSKPLIVDAGVIVARGQSDVDDAASALHDRSRIGVFSRGAYHSIDPGKLTTAPMFALEAADRIETQLRERVNTP
jgi:glycine/D-amino acid oxidase-like deaminating enzyme